MLILTLTRKDPTRDVRLDDSFYVRRYVLKTIPGKENVGADFLSRL